MAWSRRQESPSLAISWGPWPQAGGATAAVAAVPHGQAGAPPGLVRQPAQLGFRQPDLTDGYLLTRFSLACCAADAFASQVEVRNLGAPPPPDDTWVVVVGEWLPAAARDPAPIGRPPAFRLQSQAVVDPPHDPYE